jgi:D-sedoheptulose 7-phosphate isomerase
VLFAISTSGNSKNVIAAVRKAREMGLKVIVFTGGSGGELKNLADAALVVPSKKTARIQESHILVGHILCERVDELL